MINTARLMKVTVSWMTVVYTVCFAGVALFPGMRETFLYYGLHTRGQVGENIMTVTTFVSGLVIWNILAVLAVGLFAWLYNRNKA